MRRGRHGSPLRVRIAGALAALAALAAALLAAAPAAALELPDGFTAQPVTTGLALPTDVAFAPDGRAFVTEKSGKVHVVATDGTRSELLDLGARVNDHYDRGLLGVAVDADFADNGFLYLVYVNRWDRAGWDVEWQTSSRLIRVTVGADGVVPGTEVTVLGTDSEGPCPEPAPYEDCLPADGAMHTIGTVVSAGDGTLWVGSGDAVNGGGTDLRALRTLDEDSLAGKVLHVDRSGNGLPGHAFCPAETDLRKNCTKVHAMGLRNPFRFTVRPDGLPLIGDVGWSLTEELSVPPAGANLGWPCFEGSTRTTGYADFAECKELYAAGGTTAPVLEYPHVTRTGSEIAEGSVVAGPTYTGDAYPAAFRGTAFVGDYVFGWIRRLEDAGAGSPRGSSTSRPAGPAGSRCARTLTATSSSSRSATSSGRPAGCCGSSTPRTGRRSRGSPRSAASAPRRPRSRSTGPPRATPTAAR